MASTAAGDGSGSSGSGSKKTKNLTPEIGKRIYTDGNGRGGCLSSLIAQVTLFFFVGLFYILTILLIVAAVKRSALLFTIWAVIVGTVLLPATTHWQGFLDSYLFTTWRQYFNFSFVVDVKMDPTKNYVFAEFPHGVFPMGPVLAGTIVDRVFKGMKVYAISASNVFRTPLYKHFFSWLGAKPATRENFANLLQKGSCAVVVGGLAEMYMQEKDCERIKLKSRKGFIKVAVAAGAEVVPIYHFGNTKVVSMLGRSLKNLSRALKMSFLIMYGKFGLPIPFRKDIMMAVGKPVVTKQMTEADDPEAFAAEVDRVHAEFMKRLAEVYDKYRGMYGWEDMPLRIE